MSFREYDYSYVNHMCKEWLDWHNAEISNRNQKLDNLPVYKQWFAEPTDGYLIRERQRIEALKELTETDGGLNRIVNLSSEDCWILNIPKRKRKK